MEGDGPGDAPAVVLAIDRLEAALHAALGDETEFVLIVLAKRGSVSHVEAVTNTTETRARDLLRIVDRVGFDTYN